MTVGVAGDRDYRDLSGPAKPSPKVSMRPVRGGRLFGVRAGQIVATQVAAVAVVVGALNGPIGLAAGAAVALLVLAVTWLRLRRRWLFEWFGVMLRFGGRRHAAAVDTQAALLELVAPGARVEQTDLAGDPAAIIVDGRGLTAVLELGDPAGLLAEDSASLPSPASLLPSAEAELPPVLIQLLLTGAPAPSLRAGAGTPANSYRQLTEGRLLGHSRALLAVRVLRAEGWSPEELHRSLSGLVRKLVRRLSAVPAKPLGEAAAMRVIAELAHHDGVGPAQETWPGLRVGGLAQSTFQLRRWPDPRVETSRRLISRLLTLPASATTVSLTAGPRPAHGPTPLDLTIRLAAPDTGTLGTAAQALHKVVAAEQASVRRLDGEQLSGLSATLPLGGSPSAVPGLPPDGLQPAERLEGLDLPVGTSGLMLGRNRHGNPVVARLFRPEQTRVLLIGGVRCAQLVVLRAMALGARVMVQTARPRAWEPFVRGAAVPGESIAVVPPGRPVEIAPGSALQPLLVVVDIGPVGSDTRPGAGWQATLVVRDEFSAADVDVASRADLLVLQPLRPDEATLIGGALGLGEVAQWMTKIRPDMVGVVNRRAVRWAALAHTPIETQLVGPPGR
ncbi:type VII secretion protein EccE [Paractinoplanes atraurantiacus]|uniref:Type VII secretion protein EccE n=1 Tax=Paractinoplanes atraurantiacus TaxID=1036182 RepID=A0A285KEE1_9ACTN|nr:type VII secretion protein EccE [Actinoplanes atraurantiacus]SNY70958.1 type VII secretion protein EccE [Actinoplanes atraurantiacus]